MPKSPDAFRTISEVAEWLGVQTHVLRFWESKFTHVKPIKRAGGRRYYRPADMLLLGGIKRLLYDDGLTIKGAQKMLRENGIAHVAAMSQPLDDLTMAVIEGEGIAPSAPAPIEPTAFPEAGEDVPDPQDEVASALELIATQAPQIAEPEHQEVYASEPAKAPPSIDTPKASMMPDLSDAKAHEDPAESASPEPEATPTPEPQQAPAMPDLSALDTTTEDVVAPLSDNVEVEPQAQVSAPPPGPEIAQSPQTPPDPVQESAPLTEKATDDAPSDAVPEPDQPSEVEIAPAKVETDPTEEATQDAKTLPSFVRHRLPDVAKAETPSADAPPSTAPTDIAQPEADGNDVTPSASVADPTPPKPRQIDVAPVPDEADITVDPSALSALSRLKHLDDAQADAIRPLVARLTRLRAGMMSADKDARKD